MLDAEQLRAAYGVLILKQQIIVISGPAGSGKSELLKLFVAVLGCDDVRVVAPTQGARRVCQKNIDKALPRLSFKPEVEALTTFVGFGCAWGETWEAKKIVSGMRRGESRRRCAKELYKAKMVVVDEGAQAPIEHLDTADVVAQMQRECNQLMDGIQLVLLMDAVQTPPVGARRARRPSAEMLWEATLLNWYTVQAWSRLAGRPSARSARTIHNKKQQHRGDLSPHTEH